MDEKCEEGREHMSCFGEYCTAAGAICVDGYSKLCDYSIECQKSCVYYEED